MSSAANPPFGFRRLDGPGSIAWVAEAWTNVVAENDGPALLAKLASEASRAETSSGRGRSGVIALGDHAPRVHVREFRHGGWLGPLRGGRLRSIDRPFEEIRVHEALHTAGAPVPDPLFALAWRAGPARGWRALVATGEVSGAIDARAFLSSSPSRANVLAAARAAGTSLRRFHDAGGCHADLHIGNLLVRNASREPRVVVVDLDRAQRRPSVVPQRRMQELMRLHRSLVKRGWVDRIGPRGYASFWSAYLQGDRALRSALRASLARERRRLAWHRAGYRLRGLQSD